MDLPTGMVDGIDGRTRSMACLRSGIRLDDCTRQSLGMLPRDDKFQDECEDKSGDERSDNDNLNYDDDSKSGEWGAERFLHSRKATVVPWTDALVGRISGGRDEEMSARIR